MGFSTSRNNKRNGRRNSGRDRSGQTGYQVTPPVTERDNYSPQGGYPPRGDYPQYGDGYSQPGGYPYQNGYYVDPGSTSPSGGRQPMDTDKKRSWTALQYICIAVGVILAILFVVKAGQIVIGGIGPAVEAFKDIVSVIFNRFVEAVIGAVVIYFLATMFLGRYLPASVKKKIIPVCVVLILLYSIAPALSTAIGELMIILVGFAILAVVFR